MNPFDRAQDEVAQIFEFDGNCGFGVGQTQINLVPSAVEGTN